MNLLMSHEISQKQIFQKTSSNQSLDNIQTRGAIASKYIYKMLMLDHNNHDAFIKIPFNYHFMLSKTIWKYMPKN